VTNLGFARTSSTSSSALTRSFIGAQPLTCASDFDLVARNAVRPRSVVFADTSRRGRGSTTKSATPEWRRRRQRRANWCGTWSNRVAAIPRPRRSTPLPPSGARRHSEPGSERHGADRTYLLNRFTRNRVRWSAGHPQSPHCGFPSLWRFTSSPNRQRRPQPLARMASPRSGARPRR